MGTVLRGIFQMGRGLWKAPTILMDIPPSGDGCWAIFPDGLNSYNSQTRAILDFKF